MFDNWFAFHVARNDTELPSASPFAHHQHMIPSPASQSLVAVRKGIGRHAPRWREQWRRRYDFRCQQLKVICSGIPSVLPPRCPPRRGHGTKTTNEEHLKTSVADGCLLAGMPKT